MPLQTLCRPLAILLVVLLAACAQQQKQTKGTPPLTDEDAQPAPVVSGEPIPKDQVDPDRAAGLAETAMRCQDRLLDLLPELLEPSSTPADTWWLGLERGTPVPL